MLGVKSGLEQDSLYREFMRELLAYASARDFSTVEIGDVDGEPILLLTSRPKPCRVLIAAGFHGDEPGGARGIIEFLRTAPRKLFSACAISFLPLVNPTGFSLGQRLNRWQEDPNRGFCHSGTESVSREGRILLRESQLLTYLAGDGFLSLHEDVEAAQYYLYTFERSDAPGLFSWELRDIGESFFSHLPDGTYEGAEIRDGIAFHHCDGAFEDFLFHQGVPRTACTETPGLCSLATRASANSEIIKTFVSFAIQNRSVNVFSP